MCVDEGPPRCTPDIAWMVDPICLVPRTWYHTCGNENCTMALADSFTIVYNDREYGDSRLLTHWRPLRGGLLFCAKTRRIARLAS